jgi:Flp pilus assembly pilin Flp
VGCLVQPTRRAEGAEMIWIRRFTNCEDAQDLIEYTLLAALIAIVAMSGVKLFGDTISNVLWGSIALNF